MLRAHIIEDAIVIAQRTIPAHDYMDRECRENHVKNQKLALPISDASWAKFVNMLEYKALWHDRIVQKVSRFYPSSQTCNYCGFINPEVKNLDVREWDCPRCEAHHFRDWNAAKNIRDEGLRLLVAVGAPETLNACRDDVRP